MNLSENLFCAGFVLGTMEGGIKWDKEPWARSHTLKCGNCFVGYDRIALTAGSWDNFPPIWKLGKSHRGGKSLSCALKIDQKE